MEKEKELQPGGFSSGYLSRCLSDVPCAAAVVVRHKKPAGRLAFASARVLNDSVNVAVNTK